MKNSKLLNSPRLLELKRKRTRIFIVKFSILIVLILGLIVGLYFISRIQKLNINNIEVIGNKVVDTEMIKKVVNDDLAGKYFWLFPKTNFLIYPKSKIIKDLSTQLGRLKNISMGVTGTQVLTISLSEREGKYIWCGATPPETKDTKEICYFIDKDGYIFDQAPYFSGEVYFKFYGSSSGAGSYFAQNIFSNLIAFKEGVEAMKLKPVAFYLSDNGDMNMLLSSPKSLSGNPKIVFSKDSDFQKITENLEAALDAEPFKTDVVKKYSSLQYIDLRFGNKVYYKFR